MTVSLAKTTPTRPTTEIAAGDVKPGDVLHFLGTDYLVIKSKTHVSVTIGGGTMVQALTFMGTNAGMPYSYPVTETLQLVRRG